MTRHSHYKFIPIISVLGILCQSSMLFAAQLPDNNLEDSAPAYSVENFMESNERLASVIEQQSVSVLEDSDIPSLPVGHVLREYFFSNGTIKKREYRNAQTKLVQVWIYTFNVGLTNIQYLDAATGRKLRYEYYDAQKQLTSASDYDITRSANRITKTTTYFANDLINSEATYNPANGYQTDYIVNDENEVLFQKDTFNSSGKKTKSTFYYPSGREQTISQYNVSTNKIILSEYFDTDGKLTQRREFTSGGVPTKTTFYAPSGLKTSANFYISGKLSSTEWYFDNGNRSQKNTFTTTGAVSKTEYFSRSAVIKQKLEFKVTTAIALRKTDFDTDGQIMYLTEYNAANQITKYVDYVHVNTAESSAIYSGLIRLQTAAGLIPSHPEDQSFIYHEGIVADWAIINAKDQAYTYDQAIFGIAMVKNSDLVAAKKILDFFYTKYSDTIRDEGIFSGFWTVYDKDGGWKKYEYRKGMGENAWMALFALQYANATTDPAEQAKALELAKGITGWIATLPHYNGAVAMGPLTGGNPDFGKIYSTENMLDYYALLRDLTAQLPAGIEKNALLTEFNNLKGWLKNSAFDKTKGLFRQGGSIDNAGAFTPSTVQSLDVNSWAIQAIGVAPLIQDFGINLATFVTKIETTFAVQPNGSYGGNITTALGFDFSDAANAAAILAQGKPRPALVWGEGTAGMIASYWKIAQYYRSINSTTNAVKYETRALYFANKLKASSLRILAADGSVTHRYASADSVVIYSNNLGLKTPLGTSSGISSAWIFLSLMKFNPFFV